MQLPTIDEIALLESPPNARRQRSRSLTVEPPHLQADDDDRRFGQVLADRVLDEPSPRANRAEHPLEAPLTNATPATAAAVEAVAADVQSPVELEIISSLTPSETIADDTFHQQLSVDVAHSKATQTDTLPTTEVEAPALAAEFFFESPEDATDADIAAVGQRLPAQADAAATDQPRFNAGILQASTSDLVSMESQQAQNETSSDAPDSQAGEPQRELSGPTTADGTSVTSFNTLENVARDSSSASSTAVESSPTKSTLLPDASPVTRVPSGYQFDVQPPGMDGKVVVFVRQSRLGVEAHFDAPGKETHQLLQNSLTAIREHLESTGVDLGSLSLGLHEGNLGSETMDEHRDSTHADRPAAEPTRDNRDQDGRELAAAATAPTRWDGQLNVLA